eukprot:m.122931 g.122931  ORF g.122931 m.122931 type:complete len:57 (+) comp37809_c0_seq3:899-1069(+)
MGESFGRLNGYCEELKRENEALIEENRSYQRKLAAMSAVAFAADEMAVGFLKSASR